MVTTGDRLVVSVVVKRAVSSSAVRSDSGASHVSVVAGTVVTGTGSKRSVAGSRSSRDSSDLRVTELAVAVLALPELATGATSVVVGGAGSKALLLLVVTSKEHLHRNGEEEEEAGKSQLGVVQTSRDDNLRSDDSNRKTGSVEPADGTKRGRVGDLVTLTIAAKALPRVGGTVAERGVDIAGAAGCAVTGKDSDSNHCTAAESVEDQADEGKEGLAAKAAGEDNSANGVEHCRARQTFNRLLPARNRNIAVSLNGKEV